MKTETKRPTSTIPHPRYPSLSDNFGRDRSALPDLPISPKMPRPDPVVRMIYLRLIIVVGLMTLLAAVVANA
jgi:hypothetical protein